MLAGGGVTAATDRISIRAEVLAPAGKVAEGASTIAAKPVPKVPFSVSLPPANLLRRGMRRRAYNDVVTIRSGEPNETASLAVVAELD